MPKEVFGNDYAFLPPDELLNFDEIIRLATIFASLGVRKIRLTGGEPLLRHNLDHLIQDLIQINGIEDIGLTTNGVLLKKQGKKLFDAGLRRLNISLDALDALDGNVFGQLNGRGVKPQIILDNIDYAVKLGFQVKINMVVQKGINEKEIIPMATYFKNKNITLRFIEFMDVGNDNGWSFEKVVTKKEMFNTLQQHFTLEPIEHDYFGEVAKRYKHKNQTAEIGFITSVSESFCSSCTRARLSSDGKLFTCLFASEGFDLSKLIRSGISDKELLQVIIDIWENRKDRYSDERTEDTINKQKKIDMSYIGG